MKTSLRERWRVEPESLLEEATAAMGMEAERERECERAGESGEEEEAKGMAERTLCALRSGVISLPDFGKTAICTAPLAPCAG